MTIEELYALREQILSNKAKFSELNNKYNEFLSKRNTKKSKDKKLTEKEYILVTSHILYWGRFFVLAILVFAFNLPNDIALIGIFANLGIKIVDDHIILPRVWKKKQVEGTTETRTEKSQREMYEEVSEARTLYHELNRKYEREFSKLSGDDKLAYLEYLESLGLSLDLEEKEEEVPSISSGDIKMLNMVYEEQ